MLHFWLHVQKLTERTTYNALTPTFLPLVASIALVGFLRSASAFSRKFHQSNLNSEKSSPAVCSTSTASAFNWQLSAAALLQ
jgi:hypothetical protein